MALIELRRDAGDKELRVFFGLLLPAFAAIVALIAWLRFGAPGAAVGVAGGVAAVSVVGVAAPRAMKPVFLAWMWAAYPIGWVVGHVLLAAVFFGVVTPIGLARRAAGRDPMQRRFDRSAASYWIRRPESPGIERYFRQY